MQRFCLFLMPSFAFVSVFSCFDMENQRESEHRLIPINR